MFSHMYQIEMQLVREGVWYILSDLRRVTGDGDYQNINKLVVVSSLDLPLLTGSSISFLDAFLLTCLGPNNPQLIHSISHSPSYIK